MPLVVRRRYPTVNCYYHPNREAETKCISCKKYICTEDIQRKKEISNNLLVICCCCFSNCGISPWEERVYCVKCYNKKFSNRSPKIKHHGSILKDL